MGCLNHLKVFVVTGAFCFIMGCGPELEKPRFSNPYDSRNDNFIAPLATINFGPQNNDTLSVDSVNFSWSGNQYVVGYSYLLSGQAATWSLWDTSASASYRNLADGNYTFSVNARYINGDESTSPTQVIFTIDMIQGTALLLRPKSIQKKINEEFAIEIYADEIVDSLMLAEVIITFDATLLQITGDSVGSFLGSNNGTVVFLDTVTTGQVKIVTGVTEGNPRWVNGGGILAKIKMKGIKVGQSNMHISAADSSTLIKWNNTSPDISKNKIPMTTHDAVITIN